MSLESAITGSAFDIPTNPRGVLKNTMKRIVISEIVDMTGGSSMFWGEHVISFVKEVFLSVSTLVINTAVVSSGKTENEIIDIAVDKGLSDAAFIRLAQNDLELNNGIPSPKLIRMAENIIRALVTTDEINEEAGPIREVFDAADEASKFIEEMDKVLHDITDTDLADLMGDPHQQLEDKYNEYGTLITDTFKQTKENLNIISPAVDAIASSPEHIARSIDPTGTGNTYEIAKHHFEPLFAAGRAAMALPGELADSVTDFIGDEYDNIMDILYIRGASRGR